MKQYAIRNTQCDIRHQAAFTLIELLIVVAILGILAAVTLPSIQGHIQDAKEAAAKDNLRILRDAIERYANDHDGIAPGYFADKFSSDPQFPIVYMELASKKDYLSELPENPFSNKFEMKVLTNNDDFPQEPSETETFGWIYKPATKTIKLNWHGTDSKGVKYFDY